MAGQGACHLPGSREPGAGATPSRGGCRGRPGAPSPRGPRARPKLCAPAAAPRGSERRAGGCAHRWLRLDRRGREGDVTGSGPGGRNRAASAAVAQQWAAVARRAGAATTSRAPRTRQEPQRPTARGAGSPLPLPPRGAPASGSPATWAFLRPQLLQVRGSGEGAKPPPPTPGCTPSGPLRPRVCVFPQGRSGRLLVLPARAGRAKFARLARGGHGITERGLGRATPARAGTRGKGWGAETWGPRLLEGPE